MKISDAVWFGCVFCFGIDGTISHQECECDPECTNKLWAESALFFDNDVVYDYSAPDRTKSPETLLVKISDLVPTQRHMSMATIERYAKHDELEPVAVIKVSGRLLLANGHHRVCACVSRGESHIEVLRWEPITW